jgi:hypothetical protein
MHYQGFETVTVPDVAAQWFEHHSAALGTDNENTIRENVATFFNLAEAAGFGQIVRGGGPSRVPTRLRIDRDELKRHIEAGPSAPPSRSPSFFTRSQKMYAATFRPSST